jgi:S1-C subfamily serine protease
MRRTIWVLSIVGIASMMWLLQSPLRTYGQGQSDAPKAPVMSAPSSAVPHLPDSDRNDCDCSPNFSSSFTPMTFGALSLGPLAFGQTLDRKKLDKEVRDEIEKARKEIETAMKSEDWQKLSEIKMPDLSNLQAELRETIPQALQEAERKVIAISPMDNDEDMGWLGVEVAEVSPEQVQQFKLAEARGAVVISVDPDSPAAKAGIREKDVILTYEGEKVEGVVQFRRLVRETPPGRQIQVGVSRDGSAQSVQVNIGSRQDQFSKHGGEWGANMPPMPSMPNVTAIPNMPDMDENYLYIAPGAMGRTPMLGISAEDLTGQLGTYFGTPNGEGVLVRDVKAGSAAEKAGLKAGDVIVKLDDKDVRTLRDLRAELREKSDQKSVQVGVLRKGSSMNVTIPIEKPKPLEFQAPVHRAQL